MTLLNCSFWAFRLHQLKPTVQATSHWMLRILLSWSCTENMEEPEVYTDCLGPVLPHHRLLNWHLLSLSTLSKNACCHYRHRYYMNANEVNSTHIKLCKNTWSSYGTQYITHNTWLELKSTNRIIMSIVFNIATLRYMKDRCLYLWSGHVSFDDKFVEGSMITVKINC